MVPFQLLEPTVGGTAGLLLIGWSWCSGSSRDGLCSLVDRPEGGAYVRWICEEKRADRRLDRALDRIRSRFEHRPCPCWETHVGGRTKPASPLPFSTLW